MSKQKVIIIGSGLGGLSCGVVLAKNGYTFFTYVSVFPCSGWLLVLSIHTSEWLEKTG